MFYTAVPFVTISDLKFQISCSQRQSGLRCGRTFFCESVVNKYPIRANIGSIALLAPQTSRYVLQHHEQAVFTLHIKQDSDPASQNDSTSPQIKSARAAAETQSLKAKRISRSTASCPAARRRSAANRSVSGFNPLGD